MRYDSVNPYKIFVPSIKPHVVWFLKKQCLLELNICYIKICGSLRNQSHVGNFGYRDSINVDALDNAEYATV